MNIQKDGPPPQYPGHVDHGAFENIELDQMDKTGTPLPTPPRPVQAHEEPNIHFYRPAPRLKRRAYIIALVALAIMVIILATFAGILVRSQPPAPSDSSTTPIESNTPALPWRPTTVISVSTATPTTTLVTVTTQTSDVFGITVLPSHSTAESAVTDAARWHEKSRVKASKLE
jgi:hypothetical protein